MTRGLAGHDDAVRAVAFSPDGNLVLTGSGNKTARLREVATGKPVATLAGHDDAVWAVAFSPDGKLALTGSGDKTARLWEIFPSAQALVEVVKASVPRCLTAAGREQFHLGTAAPPWCHARNLWPFTDQGAPASNSGNSPQRTWDEWLVAAWDRATGWFAGSASRQ